VPLTPEAWTATDSIRFVTHLGRPALYINRGVALARKVAMENGVLELDVTATEATNFPGVAFPSGVSAVLQRGVPAAGCERDRGSGAVRPGGGMVGDLLPAVHQWPGRGPAPEESLGPYQSSPEYPWHRLRDEHPGVYESYADMEAGAWTTMRIEVEETKARLYVNGATQPCLVVNDLKNGDRAGRIALWPT
jgi:hypothetical protein